MKHTHETKAQLIERLARAEARIIEMEAASARHDEITRRFEALHSLSLRLSQVSNLDETMRLCLETALRHTSLDSGGVYMVESDSGALHLQHSQGLSADFVAATAHYDAGHPSAQLVGRGDPVYIDYADLAASKDPARRAEALRSVAVIPICFRGQTIACLNLASHELIEVPVLDRQMLETLATLFANFVARAREQARREQMEAEALRMSRAIEGSLNEIYIFAADTLRFEHVNHGAVHNLGYTRDELLRMTPVDIKPEFCAESFERLLRPLRQGEHEKLQFSTTHRRKDGSLYPVDVHLQLVREGAPSFIAIIQDVSERRKNEKERASLQQQLHHSQKMEAVGRLAGGVAHDFNNVLCAISGNAELALEDLGEGEPLHDLVAEILVAARRASDLTRQLLAFSRKQIVAPKVIDLSLLVDGLHGMLSRLIGEDIVLRSIATPGLGKIRADVGQIEQVVLNLAVNARDAMPDGGELIIETADVSLDEHYCKRHALAEPGDYVMLAVSDTGCGIDPDIRDKIFEPFFTTKKTGHGTGLGLATVFGIVKQSGGRVEVYSELGQGTTFKVYLKRVDEDAPKQAVAPKAAIRSSGRECVLLVEDEGIVRRLAVKFLRRMGYQVLVAGSGHEALTLAAEHAGRIDLLLTDVVMPHMNGRELATRLIEQRPDLKVVYTSGYTHNVIAHHGVLDEGVQFISKPYTLESLSACLRQVLDGAES